MTRGGKRSHKGGRRQFTNPQALEQERLKEAKEKAWRRQRGEEDSDTSDDEEVGEGASGQQKKEETESSSEEESSDDNGGRWNGVGSLIKIENPNRIVKKNERKVTDLKESEPGSSPKLSRREREEIALQQSIKLNQKLRAAGETEEARADLARLAIIRKRREEAAKKREEEKKSKELLASQKRESKLAPGKK